MPPLDHTIRLEQSEKTAPPAAHRGAIITDPRLHRGTRPSQQTLQTRHDGIFSDGFAHRKNMMAVTDTALKTACMIIGTNKLPDFS